MHLSCSLGWLELRRQSGTHCAQGCAAACTHSAGTHNLKHTPACNAVMACRTIMQRSIMQQTIMQNRHCASGPVLCCSTCLLAVLAKFYCSAIEHVSGSRFVFLNTMCPQHRLSSTHKCCGPSMYCLHAQNKANRGAQWRYVTNMYLIYANIPFHHTAMLPYCPVHKVGPFTCLLRLDCTSIAVASAGKVDAVVDPNSSLDIPCRFGPYR